MSVDLRRHARARRPRVLLAAFEHLKPGQALTFISDDGELPALALLQGRSAGSFGWHVLSVVDGVHEFQVTRRRNAVHQVTGFMEMDHRRIHALLEDTLRLARAGDTTICARAARHLETGLATHIDIEETYLLPLIAARIGSPRGPAFLLREEHVQIRALAGEVRAAADRGASADTIVGAAGRLARLLANHAGIEERLVYELVDLLLPPAEREKLLRHCQRAAVTLPRAARR